MPAPDYSKYIQYQPDQVTLYQRDPSNVGLTGVRQENGQYAVTTPGFYFSNIGGTQRKVTDFANSGVDLSTIPKGTYGGGNGGTAGGETTFAALQPNIYAMDQAYKDQVDAANLAANPNINQMPATKSPAYGSAAYIQQNPSVALNSASSGVVTAPAGTSPTSGYTGPSIVDYLGSVGKPSDYTSRSKLASVYGIQNYTGTATQNTQLLNSLRSATQPVAPPATVPSSIITPGAMKTEKAVVIPGATTTPTGTADATGASTAATSLAADIQARIDATNATKTATEKQADSLMAGLVSDESGLAGKAKMEADLRIQKEDALNTQLTSVKNQIEALNAEKEKFRVDNEGQPMTLSRLTGAVAQNNAKLNGEILTLTAMGNALINNIALAESQIKQAVDAKYGPLLEGIAIKKSQLEAIQPTLTADQKIRADALKAYYDKQDQAIADAKAASVQIGNLMLKASEAGVTDQNILSRILNSKTLQEAQQIYAENVKPEVETTIREIGNRTYLLNAKTGEKIKDLGYSGPTGGSGSGGGSSSGGFSGKLSPQAQAIADNPSLLNDLTPTARGKVITELSSAGYDTTNLGAKALSDTAIAKIADFESGLAGLQDLKVLIKDKSNLLGPVTGLAALNPWSEARKLQANINLIKQKVGKALEGGVLRKEDEVKYKQILATLTDTPETAAYKTDALITSLQRDLDSYSSLQQSGGRSTNVNAPLTKKSTTVSTGSTPGGNSYTVTKE